MRHGFEAGRAALHPLAPRRRPRAADPTDERVRLRRERRGAGGMCDERCGYSRVPNCGMRQQSSRGAGAVTVRAASVPALAVTGAVGAGSALLVASLLHRVRPRHVREQPPAAPQL